MKNKPRFERTIVLLKPELLVLNMIDWITSQLNLTGCKVLTTFDIVVTEEMFNTLPPRRPVSYKIARSEHLNGKYITILVIEGPDAIRRIRKIIGKQHDPHDWNVSSIKGWLRDHHGLQWLVRRDGKKYFMDYLECPQSKAAAKRTLKWFKKLSMG